jgi:hypothetical protein
MPQCLPKRILFSLFFFGAPLPQPGHNLKAENRFDLTELLTNGYRVLWILFRQAVYRAVNNRQNTVPRLRNLKSKWLSTFSSEEPRPGS